MTVSPDVFLPGGDPLLGWIIERMSATAVGTAGGVTATLAARPGLIICPTAIQVSGDAACLVSIQSPSGTTIWRMRFTGAFTWTQPFAPATLRGDLSAAVLLVISASGANCEANIQAVSLNWNDYALPDPVRLRPRVTGKR